MEETVDHLRRESGNLLLLSVTVRWNFEYGSYNVEI